MADLDVSEMLLDPDFVDPIQIIRRTSIVDSHGKNVISELVTNSIASVQPAKFKDIQRLPEAMRLSDIRSFYLRAEIVKDGASDYPDILMFKGKRFQIQTAAPWGNFGSGWFEGIAVAEKPA